MENFGGQLSITCLKENGWIINSVPESSSPQVMIQKVGRDFNIEHAHVWNGASDYDMRLFKISQLSSGGYLMSIDYPEEGPFGNRIGILVWLDENLDEIRSHTIAEGHSCRFIELPDNTVVIGTIRQSGWVQLGPGRFGYDPNNVRTIQLLESNGAIRYSVKDTLEATHMEVIGLSYTGSSFVYNAVINDEHLQHYSAIDVQTGEQTDESLLPANYINNQLVRSYSNGHFPIGQANSLPEFLGPGQGTCDLLGSRQKAQISIS